VHPVPDHRLDERYWDSNEYPKGPYEYGGGEADYPQHCDGCGLFLENSLTEDGVYYVLRVLNRAVENGPPYRDHIVDWADEYRHYPLLGDVADTILEE